MQNVGSQKSAHTEELNLDLARDPTSLSSIPDAEDATAVTHSEPEVRPKEKTRSRFTSALRKLSKSKRKKEQAKQELSKQLQGTAAASVISSGAEKPAEPVAGTTSEQPKKQSSSKLTRRFILGSLRKSKNSSKKNAVAAADVEGGIQEQTKHAAEQSSNSSTVATVGGDTEVGSQIEQAQAAAADSNYLTPSIDASATNTAKESAAALKEGKKKKLKSKKNSSGGRSTQTQKSVPPPADAAAASAQITRAPAEEKFVITRSARDTPPPERAPAKPSRAAVTTSFQGDSSQTRDAAATTTSIAQPPIAQESFSSSSKQQRATTIAFSESTATGLMQQQASQRTLQRGHRFPNPKATTTFSSSDSGNATPPTTATTSAAAAATTAKSSTAQQQRQLQFQLQSHASPPSQSVPPTAALKQEQQPLQQLQSNAPPTASTPLAKPATRSPAHRRQHSESASLPVHAADDSVYYTHSSGPDDAISSAESAYPSDSHLASGNNIQNPQLSGHTPSQDSPHSASTNASTIRFAIGSAVRPAGASFDSLHDQLSIDSDRSTDSQSPISESSRKRIRYLAQPTLFDEFESLQRRRETLKYQTGVASDAVSLEFDDGASAGGKHSSMPAFGDLTMDQEMEPAIMTSSSSEKREHLYKILVIGELGTGKTSFIKRYVHQFFSQNYRATIGVDFALKVLHWDKDTVVRLQLWDIAGQERFGNMTRVYYKEAVGAFIVFDVTRSGTFECVSKWKEDLDSKVQLPDGSPIPCILLANKCDQDKQGLVTSPEKMDDYVKENGFAGWFETSAKENINIDEAARALVNKILLNDKLISAADIADSEKFNLNNSSEDQTSRESKNKCSC